MKLGSAVLLSFLIPLSLSALDRTPPQAVVSLTLMTDEFLADLLPVERIRAFSRSVDDPVLSNAVEAGKKVKGRAWLDLETLIRLKPDLILAADWSESADLDFLRKKGFAVSVVKTPKNWSEVREAIVTLGDLLVRQDAAALLLGSLDKRRAALDARRAGLVPATVLEYNSFGSSMGSGTLWNEMMALAGLNNLSARLPADDYGYAPISRELLLKLDPDWLVLPSAEALTVYGQPGFLQELQSDPLYKGLKAVRNGHLIFLSEALKTTTSHAILGAAEAMQRAAYPDLR